MPAPRSREDVQTLAHEQRQQIRTEHLRGRQLQVDYCGQVVTARVVDTSGDGLGVEMSAELRADSVISFRGLGLRGCGRITHCKRGDDGVFRAGLKVETMSFDQNQGTSQEDFRTGLSEPSKSRLASVRTQEEGVKESAKQSSSPNGEWQSSTILSEMAQTISQTVQAGLLNLERQREDELKAISQRVDLLLRAVRALHEIERQRQNAIQQLTKVTGSLEVKLPPVLDELADDG